MAAAFTPHVARIHLPDKKFAQVSSGALEVDPEARRIKYFVGPNGGGGRAFVHPSSTLFSAQSFVGGATFMAYFTKMGVGRAEDRANSDQSQGNKIFIRDLTPVSAYHVLLLGGDLRIDTLGRGMTIDGWMRVRGWGRIGVLVGMVRRLVEEVLRGRVAGGGGSGGRGQDELRMEREVMKVVRRLMEGEGY